MAIKNYTSKVDVYTSIGEIQGEIARHGARKIMVDYNADGRPTSVTFAIDTTSGMRGFVLPANIGEVFLPYMTDGRGNTLYGLYSTGRLALPEVSNGAP
jgi:hypothetical protein